MASYTDTTKITHGKTYTIMQSSAIIAASSAFSRSYYRISGWSCGGSTYGLASTITNITGNLSIYALWSEGWKLKITDTTKTVRFDSTETGTTLQFLDSHGGATIQSPYASSFTVKTSIKTVDDNGGYITAVGNHAFNGCTNLNGITFDSCITIGNYAFSGTGLANCTFPRCTTIGEGAFCECTSLWNPSFSKCVTIGAQAFRGCVSLTSPYFPICTTIGSSAFKNCTAYSDAYFSSCEYINEYAFTECTSLKSACFRKCVDIGSYAFSGCVSLESLAFESCKTIGEAAFLNCSALVSPMVDFGTCQTVGSGAFAGCIGSQFTDLSLPKCTYIGECAFEACEHLHFYGEAIFPECLQICDYAFSGCIRLPKITAPKCTSLSEYALLDTSLTAISFPSLSIFNDKTFNPVSKTIQDVTLGSVIITSYFGNSNTSNINWSQCGQLKTLSFPNATDIYGWAFSGCTNLVSIYASNCTYINSNYTFRDCTALKTLYFPKLTKINHCSTTFSGATNVENVTLGYNSFTRYADATQTRYWKSQWASLKTITGPECTEIVSHVFRGCNSLTTVDLPKCTAIPSMAFGFENNTYGTVANKNLQTANFQACTTIGSYAFRSCSALTTANFPVCTTINEQAFQSCYALITADFPSCTTIGSYAFRSCSALTTANFPVCTTIGSYAFNSCSALTTISFPACTTIQKLAFICCSALTTANFPVCTTINEQAFQSCYNLTALYLMSTAMVALATKNAFNSTPMVGYSGKTGYIYVPTSLTADYKNDTVWSNFSSRIVGV